MSQSNSNSVRSPLTPIPPTASQSSFDFSPRAIQRLEVPGRTATSLLQSPLTPYMMAVSTTSSMEDDNEVNESLEMGKILDGLKQYKNLFEKQEIDVMALLLMNDDDLQEIGVADKNDREILTLAIENLKLVT